MYGETYQQIFLQCCMRYIVHTLTMKEYEINVHQYLNQNVITYLTAFTKRWYLLE